MFFKKNQVSRLRAPTVGEKISTRVGSEKNVQVILSIYSLSIMLQGCLGDEAFVNLLNDFNGDFIWGNSAQNAKAADQQES